MQGNKSQKEYNHNFLKQNPMNDVVSLKKSAIEDAC